MATRDQSASSVSSQSEKPVAKAKQSIFVIRHGERLDNVDYAWEETAERPYDPPLTEHGVDEASTAARELFLGRDIKDIITSPFLRCLQTAQEICAVLQLSGLTTSNPIVDVLSPHCGIHQQPFVPARDVADYGIKIVQLDDRPVPRYPEKTSNGLRRYQPEFQRIADEHWPHNVVIVTHGYGVMEAVGLAKIPASRSVWVDYCGSVELTRTAKDSHKWAIEGGQKVYIGGRSLCS